MTDQELFDLLGDFPAPKTMFYAGIGSRETPAYLFPIINRIVFKLEGMGYVMRSGGANGADTFFERSITDTCNKEIYLPWKGFNGNTSPLYGVCDAARELGKKFHPVNLTKQSVIDLMARNCYQVLGRDLNTPSKFVLCWTKDGKDSGGTGQAIRVAHAYNIPVFNLYNPEKAIESLKRYLKAIQ